MVDPITLQTYSIILTGIGLIIALVYYTQTLRNSTKTRQTEILFQRLQRDAPQYEAWIEVMFVQEWTNFEELMEKYPANVEVEARAKVNYVGSLFHNLGLLLQENVTDPDLLFRIMGPTTILSTWERYEQLTKDFRRNTNDPTVWEGFEYLANETRRRYPEVTTIMTPLEWNEITLSDTTKEES